MLFRSERLTIAGLLFVGKEASIQRLLPQAEVIYLHYSADNLEEYDEYLLLKNSGARLPIDTFEFIDPIFDDEKNVSKSFYIAGVSHYLPCEDNICNFKGVNIEVGDDLLLKLEPGNEQDCFAVEIFTADSVKLGYVPRYYSREVTKRIKKNEDVVCKVAEFNPTSNCRECIKVNLTIN